MTRPTAGASCGASAGLPRSTVWSSTTPSSGLLGDAAGRGEQPGQVVDRAAQPPPAAARDRIMTTGRGQLRGPGVCPAQRPAGVDQQLLRLGGGAVGQPGQLPG